MAFSSGTYTLPGAALSTGDTVSATDHNQVRNDMATAFNLTWLRNGTAAATANIPMGGFKLTGLAAATTAGDAVRYEQFASPPAIGGTAAAAGAFTTLTSSSDSTLNGLTVGRGAGSVATNTAVGASALAANTTGAYNVAVGYQAGTSSTANNQTFVGYQAGAATTSGAANTFVGITAGVANTTGAQNTVLGGFAFAANTTGGSNTALGYQSLQANTTANNNVAVGYQAAFSNTSGSGITAIGYSALYTNTTGVNNTAIGSYGGSGTTFPALYYNTTGSYNTAIGVAALQANTTASNNTAVGYQAGYTNSSTGNSCTFLGYQAGYTSNAIQNTMIGASAGLLTTGNYNTFLGSSAGYNVSSGTKNTIVGRYDGNYGGLDIRTASNYIVLSDGDGNPRGIYDSNGSYLLGTTATVSSTIRMSIKSISGADIAEFRATDNDKKVIFRNASDTNVGNINVGASSTAYNTSSDYRLKNSVAPMIGALAKVAALKPVTYKWNVDNSDGEGFIAHELAEVCPHAVTGKKDAVDENGNPVYQGIDTSFLVATLVAAIQELKAEFDAYKATHP